MKFDAEKHHRRSIRLDGYDYTQAGAYFVTLCVYQRACLLGDLVNGEMRLSVFGDIVCKEWLRSSVVRANVVLDEFMVMPNHLHGIILLTDVGATHRVAPTTRRVAPTRPTGPAPGSIGAIVGQFKSVTTKCVNEHRGTRGVPVWQRNYYEHIIRTGAELRRIRQYIIDNPLRWALDRENPERRGDPPGRALQPEPWQV